MNKGWISIHREIQDHWLWKEKRVFSNAEAWLDILLNVNHTDQKVVIKNTLFKVQRGESIKSLDTWGKRWNWNKSKVRRFLNLLQSDLMIETKNEHKTTRLIVCNYDSYQDVRNADETQTKRKRNADETHMTPNNNDNNLNNVNNVKTIEDRKREFYNSLIPYLENYSKDVLKEFFEYWSEHGENDRKFRKEKEKSFNIERRLKTWFDNKQKWQKEKSFAKKEKVDSAKILQQKYNIL